MVSSAALAQAAPVDPDDAPDAPPARTGTGDALAPPPPAAALPEVADDELRDAAEAESEHDAGEGEGQGALDEDRFVLDPLLTAVMQIAVGTPASLLSLNIFSYMGPMVMALFVTWLGNGMSELQGGVFAPAVGAYLGYAMCGLLPVSIPIVLLGWGLYALFSVNAGTLAPSWALPAASALLVGYGCGLPIGIMANLTAHLGASVGAAAGYALSAVPKAALGNNQPSIDDTWALPPVFAPPRPDPPDGDDARRRSRDAAAARPATPTLAQRY